MQRFGSSRIGTAIMTKVLPPVDRTVYRLTKGRATIAGPMAALPVIILTTTGARSGETRTSPLNAVPLGDDLALLGTNFGTGRTPGWAFNLRSHPEASLEYNGRSFAVIAREATPAEYEDVFAAATRVYPGYAGYRARATNVVPVFVLNAVGE
jgi:deazaflavin-dependent oxidoreductase (nitroreductase family)